MNRKDFITLNTLGLIGASLFPFTPFTASQEFSLAELTGRGSNKIIGDTFKLHKEAYEAFKTMKSDAQKSGIRIKVISSYRDYQHQNRIWTRKYNRFTGQGLSPKESIYKIIEYSTIPGTSRHHWGTDLDIVDGSKPLPKDPLLAKHFEKNGPYNDLKVWMKNNGASYGFHLVYTDAPNRKGFKYEPWHFSYAPLAIPMLQAFQKIDVAKELQKINLVGSNHFDQEFINQYIAENILDINPFLIKTT
ncbi:M15 family metallopeptidase [Aquimarina brevivitae]|uniref:D-alanyl-D-alanine carboxypeptidase-like protein n=1 Tax=Aquimarina brevivitae TaxID=323412 RepID=A0A4Q7NXK3_9FLAO|nr:M15 family metallopeptidase [Aquimarina brevivitae]RZS91957.1 D-alanyl-D-alanine carboxypeptidase-like protein [Aquimarina brevivitae]